LTEPEPQYLQSINPTAFTHLKKQLTASTGISFLFDVVIPSKEGIQCLILDARFHGHDIVRNIPYSAESLLISNKMYLLMLKG
jgi:hypothetical protein